MTTDEISFAIGITKRLVKEYEEILDDFRKYGAILPVVLVSDLFTFRLKTAKAKLLDAYQSGDCLTLDDLEKE